MRIYLNIPSRDVPRVKHLVLFDTKENSYYFWGKDLPKELGWFEILTFNKKTRSTKSVKPSLEKTYIKVPFTMNVIAKASGAKFDGTAKSWYVSGFMPTALKKFEVWFPNLSRKTGVDVSDYSKAFDQQYKTM
jgi:hypothetical protein